MPSLPMPGLGSLPLLSPTDAASVTVAALRSGLLRFYRPDHLVALAAEIKTYGLGPGMGPSLAAKAFSQEIGYIDGEERVTFRELDERCSAVAQRLHEAGFAAGDRIGLLARNSLGFYLTVVGASRAGIDVGYLNTGFTAAQVEEVCASEGLSAVAVSDEFFDRIPKGTQALPLTNLGPQTATPAHDRRGLVPSPAQRSRHIILTSGTTGRPKGAARTGGGIDAVIALLTGLGLQARKRHLIAAPMFHAWGWSHMMFTLLLSSTIVTSPRFDAEETLALIERERCEVLVVVPAMMQRIMELPEQTRRSYDCSSLEVVAVSGSALTADLAHRFMDEFGDVVYNLFGSTEAAFATVASPQDLREAPGTAGRPLPGVRVRVVDAEDNDLPPGEVGSILVGSGTSFDGYTSGEDKKRVGGLVAIGDQGYFDAEGRLFVASREDDMVVTGGENVYPITVEEALHHHPDLVDIAVVGAPDDRFGQVLAAHVVMAPGSQLTLEELREWARDRLAPFQLPSVMTVHDDLPRNETGKVIKRQLRGESA
jgi:acyl-CoA synthetase (AMP-forming)/AMP-acid ligase II